MQFPSAVLALMASQAKPPTHGHSTVSTVVNAASIVSCDEPFIDITRENGVAFQAANNVSVQTYVEACADQIPPEDISSASRISNGRVAIYLKTVEAVINAVQQGLSFDNSFVELSPLLKPTTRLTLSNVYPEIPNSILKSHLSSFCKVVSQIQPIPLGFKNKKLSHIMSFRRHVQVQMNNNITPPDHLNISHKGVNYHVFLSTESVRCFGCGEFGHISRNCKKTQPAPESRPPPNDNPLNPAPVFVHGKPNPKSNVGKPNSSQPRDPNGDKAASDTRTSPKSVGPAVSTGPTGPSAARTAQPDGTDSSPVPPSVPTGVNGGIPRSTSPEIPSRSEDSTAAEAPNGSKQPPSVSTEGSKQPSPPAPTKGSSAVPPATTEMSSSRPKKTDPRRVPPPNKNQDSIWGSPPAPSRLFSEVAKRKKPPTSSPRSPENTPRLIPLKSPSPTRKMARKSTSPMQISTPTTSQALDTESLNPSTPTSVTTDTDSTLWEDSQTDEDGLASESLPTCKGPLKPEELLHFLTAVKSSKKPEHVARKFTQDIPGLVTQLRPLKSSPLLKRNLQQRIHKLIKKLDA